jgi:hypothetical protein
MSKTAKEVLLEVADNYESGRWGWIQGLGRKGDNCCPWIGLCVLAKDTDLVYSEALIALHNKVKPLGFDGVVSWNDAKDRTKEDVIKTLREVASGMSDN